MRKDKFIGIFLLASFSLGACSAVSSDVAKQNDELAVYESVSGADSVIESDNATKSKKADGFGTGKGNGGEGGGSLKEPTANPQTPISLEDAEKSKEKEPEKTTKRKIIRNADLQLEVSSTEEAQQKITAITNEKKGFVITSTQKNAGLKAKNRKSVSMKIRVPAETFQESLEEIRKIADRVIVEKVSGKDVTEEFIDIQARLKTKKALEDRYLEIMKRANTVKDALEVEKQLAGVRTQIEKIEGRKRFLENQSSLSTIIIQLRTPVELSASSTGFFYELKQAVSDGFESALAFIIFLVRVLIALLPFLLFVILPVFLLLRYFFRRFKRKKTASKIVEQEIKEDNIIDVE